MRPRSRSLWLLGLRLAALANPRATARAREILEMFEWADWPEE